MTVDKDIHYSLVLRVESRTVHCVHNKTFSVILPSINSLRVQIHTPKTAHLSYCVFVTQLTTNLSFVNRLPENGH
jgi:hypothetical protein